MMENIDKEYKTCPVCSLKKWIMEVFRYDRDMQLADSPIPETNQRFFETLSKEVIVHGLARPDWGMSYDVRRGVVVDQRTEVNIPIGAEVPNYMVKTDICLDCGCVYAIELHSHPAKKSQPLPQVILPGGFIPRNS